MGSRLDLQTLLETYVDNVYFQPPSNHQMSYPCVVYNRNENDVLYADNSTYLKRQGYSLTVMDKNPDSAIADAIASDLEYCGINQYYTTDAIYHTTLQLYY